MRKILIGTAVGVLASALLCGVATAQTEVSVQATRIMSAETVGRTTSGIPIVDVTLSYTVSLKGLDLAMAAGSAAAEKRVNDAAMAACKEIGRSYPDATPGDAACAKMAADKAMVKLHQMVADAGKAHAK
ncbi:MAG TPA: UrcA family protein [Steroidobacteraceae bacterium]|nr:UrcA family protein [Steroidobacteraceae bacterium]